MQGGISDLVGCHTPRPLIWAKSERVPSLSRSISGMWAFHCQAGNTTFDNVSVLKQCSFTSNLEINVLNFFIRFPLPFLKETLELFFASLLQRKAALLYVGRYVGHYIILTSSVAQADMCSSVLLWNDSCCDMFSQPLGDQGTVWWGWGGGSGGGSSSFGSVLTQFFPDNNAQFFLLDV